MRKNFTSSHGMPMSIITAALTLILVLSSSGSKIKVKSEDVTLFKTAAQNLDNTTHTLVDEFDYWPECGIRVMGSHLASLISLQQLNNLLPCPLYVSGPHSTSSWNLESENDFGHYNPEAIAYLGAVAEKVVEDAAFIEVTRPLVYEHLYRQMNILMVMYDAMHDTNYFSEESMQAMLNSMVEYKGDPYEADYASYLLGMLNLEDESYVYSNIGYQFLYFWARRYADGTMDQFYSILKTVFMAYWPDYKFDPEYMVFEGDYYYEEGDWEEGYYFDDSPIEDYERLTPDDAVELFRGALENLEYSYNILPEYDTWPECDIRMTGSHLASLVSLRTVNAMLPCELYVSGPHTIGNWDLYNDDDFGHYNPDAIRYLSNLADRVLSDKTFVKATKPIVSNYLQRQMFILLTLHEALDDPEVCPSRSAVLFDVMMHKGYVSFLDNGAGKNFLNKVDINDDTYVYSSYKDMFLYFWARREADGTSNLFYQALKKIYTTYYPDYRYDNSKFVK